MASVPQTGSDTMNFRRGRGREEPEINLIPLIDLLLVILIFLMVTTTYSRFAEMKVDLPAGQGEAAPQREQELVVSIAADGSMQAGTTRLPAGDDKGLLAALQAQAARSAESVVLIRADGKATHQSVIRVMEAASKAGLTRLTFATDAAAGSGR